MISKKTNCQCIRCREVRAEYKINEKITLDRINYKASDGLKLFCNMFRRIKRNCSRFFAFAFHLRSVIPHLMRDPEYLTGFRVKPGMTPEIIPALKDSAIIREVHTYGKMTEINKTQKDSPQHIGLGKKLILEAERIAKVEFGLKKMAVISGVGVRGYYKKLGYKLQDTYMVKNL